MEHTPTPWRVVENSSRYIGARVCAANKRVAETNSANAAFIVKACNAWNDPDALLARLHELSEIAEAKRTLQAKVTP